MKTIEISLPESLAATVSNQVHVRGFATLSEYVIALLHQDLQARQKEELEARLLEGLEELERGEAKLMTAADWERLRNQVRQKIQSRPGIRCSL